MLQWAPHSRGLVTTLAQTMTRAGIGRITCVGEDLDRLPELPPGTLELRGVPLAKELGFEAMVAFFAEQLHIAEARAVIVLPRRDVAEPDSISRLTCAAIRKACGGRTGPNVLVEVEDPEAAFEFVGLGVSTVFYSGHLRAALLGQACVDLGVFQFIIGLLRGRQQIRTIEIPTHLRDKSFADAALELETDARGRPMTVIGVVTGASGAGGDDVQVNPGPRTPLQGLMGLLVLVGGDAPLTEPGTGAGTEAEARGRLA